MVSNDRICTFINSLSGDTLSISTGSIYNFCREFASGCAGIRPAVEEAVLNAGTACTDATTIKMDGQQGYIRNFSTESCVLYCSMERKNLKMLSGLRVLKGYAGTLIHDHETALYHFGTAHGECNVHLARYLQKNTEETGNIWSHGLSSFLEGMNRARKERMSMGDTAFREEDLEKYVSRYDAIIADGME